MHKTGLKIESFQFKKTQSLSGSLVRDAGTTMRSVATSSKDSVGALLEPRGEDGRVAVSKQLHGRASPKVSMAYEPTLKGLQLTCIVRLTLLYFQCLYIPRGTMH